MNADLTHVDTWIFDLDNTLYPPEREVLQAVNDKMTAFTMRVTGLPWDDALALQHKYHHELGATLTGLMRDHGVDPAEFLDAAHDVMLDHLEPDLPLERALGRLPGRRLVFTNGSAKHAERVLGALGVAHRFDDVFHIEAAELVPKPRPEAFERLMRAHDVRPRASAFFEDLERNLKPAAEIGMTTVLVGPRALQVDEPFVHHRALELVPFLDSARVEKAA
ncbi:MAG TPA: pyrimidine 5'-nucleotidase [Caulobacteraceae bacterium]|jgi:putative hydrolase of the HAD superfamily